MDSLLAGIVLAASVVALFTLGGLIQEKESYTHCTNYGAVVLKDTKFKCIKEE